MVIFDSNDSPFMVLWYFYLAFLSAVIVVNIVAFALKSLISWRTRRLFRTKAKAPLKEVSAPQAKTAAKAAVRIKTPSPTVKTRPAARKVLK